MDTDMIRAKDLVYEYIRRDEDGNVESINRAIDKVNFGVNKGDFIAILGANGSGKSTLAKHINALLYPTEGSVLVNGLNTLDEKNIWQIRQMAGMVFQNPDNQIIATIVEEDVGFGPENIGVPTEEIWKRVDESLKAVGMLEFRSQSPNKLSGGQKQRVAIAGIMAMKPKCIILDEPTAMLDPNGRKEVISTVMELNKKEKVTILLITHHMDEVICADKVIVMNNGSIVMQGTPREIFSRVKDIKKYRLDVPQVTELAYELKREGLNVSDGILSIEELVGELIKLKQQSR
jgi:energy-coupling factor transport system ATP-binding protein